MTWRDHVFIAYVDDLLAIDAVRWLDDLIKSPKVSFYSNSILAQCNAATAGVGIACCRHSSPPMYPA